MYRNAGRLFGLMLCGVVYTSMPVAYSAELEPAAPCARLIYTGQTGSTSPYTVTGFPNCATPEAMLGCRFSDGTIDTVSVVNADGSFQFSVPFEIGQKGFKIYSIGKNGKTSAPLVPRLDYPLIACGPTLELLRRAIQRMQQEHIYRGWLNIVAASAPEDYHLERDYSPDSMLPPEPEDIKIYGYTLAGDTVTCIVGANGNSFSSPVREDGTFAVVLPKESIAPSTSDLPTYLVNITDNQNQLLASSGMNPGVPTWATKQGWLRDREKFIGRPVLDLPLPLVDRDSCITLTSLRGQKVLVTMWATWCGPCRRELQVLNGMYDELRQSGVALVSISVDREARDVRELVDRLNIRFPVLLDSVGVFANSLGILSVPTTLILDETGIVRAAERDTLSGNEIRALLGKL